MNQDLGFFCPPLLVHDYEYRIPPPNLSWFTNDAGLWQPITLGFVPGIKSRGIGQRYRMFGSYSNTPTWISSMTYVPSISLSETKHQSMIGADTFSNTAPVLNLKAAMHWNGLDILIFSWRQQSFPLTTDQRIRRFKGPQPQRSSIPTSVEVVRTLDPVARSRQLSSSF